MKRIKLKAVFTNHDGRTRQNPAAQSDPYTLRSFVAISDTGSMTRAAARLFMTQVRHQHADQAPEESLHLRVFERSSQGMRPTSAGEHRCATHGAC
ncbi:MAG: LysR family transcriptional regulator [Thiolinea sp.]